MARKRPPTELQLYREQMRERALTHRAKVVERKRAQLQVRDEMREAALAEARADARHALELAAREDRVRLEPVESEGSSAWSGLAVGLGIAALVGVAGVLVYLIVRKRDGQVIGAAAPGLGYVPIPMPQPILISGSGVSAELSGSLQSLASALQPQGQWSSSLMKSFTLPSLNDRTRGAIRVAQATDVPYEIMLRVLGKPGAYASFSLTTNDLDQYDGNPVTMPPIGDNLILPTSQHTWLRLKPREVLYAKGSENGVIVSVSANEAVGGAYRNLR